MTEADDHSGNRCLGCWIKASNLCNFGSAYAHVCANKCALPTPRLVVITMLVFK